MCVILIMCVHGLLICLHGITNSVKQGQIMNHLQRECVEESIMHYQ